MSIDFEKVQKLNHRLVYELGMAHHMALAGGAGSGASGGARSWVQRAAATVAEIDAEITMEKIAGEIG